MTCCSVGKVWEGVGREGGGERYGESGGWGEVRGDGGGDGRSQNELHTCCR